MFFSLLENISAYSDPYFSCMSCLQDFTFLNINLTTLRMLILSLKNSTFGDIMSWSGWLTENGPVHISDLNVSLACIIYCLMVCTNASESKGQQISL